MISVIVAIIVSLATSGTLPANQTPNTGNPTEKSAQDKKSDPTMGSMGGTGSWSEGG